MAISKICINSRLYTKFLFMNETQNKKNESKQFDLRDVGI